MFFNLSAVLFCLGVFMVLTRRNGVALLMGVELILNAANINFVAFARAAQDPLEGQIMTLFCIVIAAAEAAVALAILLNIYQNHKTVELNKINKLKE